MNRSWAPYGKYTRVHDYAASQIEGNYPCLIRVLFAYLIVNCSSASFRSPFNSAILYRLAWYCAHFMDVPSNYSISIPQSGKKICCLLEQK